jgi:Ca2+-binding RTX toxin-like protein
VVGTDAGESLDGGAGADSLAGAGANDSLSGGAGDDTLLGEGQSDLMLGAGGADLLLGLNRNDTAMGQGGNDTLTTGSAAEMMMGGAGNDLFVNGAGIGNTLNGGKGLNFAQVLNPADTLSDIVEILDPGAASAAAPLPAIAAASDVTAPPSPEALLGADPLTIDGTAGADNISVTADVAGNLTVTNNGVVTHPGNQSAFSAVLIRGHQGADTLAFASSVTIPAVIEGGGGADSVSGGGGIAALVGGGGSDTLVGGTAANLLIPGGLANSDHPMGNDSLVGGPSGSDNYADFVRRSDSLRLVNNGNPVSGDAAAGEAITIDPSVQNLFAGSGTDTVKSTVAGSLLTAGTGQDSLASGGAGTTLQAGPTGSGSDTIRAAGGTNALLLANGHSDVFIGVSASDVVSQDDQDIQGV